MDYYSKDGKAYKSYDNKLAADSRYEQNEKLLREQERANDIQQQRLNEEREYRMEQERKEQQRIEAEKIKFDMEICDKVGLNYDLIYEFAEIIWWFDWNRYLKVNRSEGDEISKKTGVYEIINKIVLEFKSKKSYYYMFNTFTFGAIFFFIIALMSELSELVFGALLFVAMFLPFSIIFHKKYKLAYKELDRIKKFFEDYTKSGKKALDSLLQYREDNYIAIYDQIIGDITGYTLNNDKTKKTTRVDRLKIDDIGKDTEQINNGAGEKYNYKMASILDEYDQDIKCAVDNLSNKNNIVNNCNKCGATIEEGEKFCGKCGNKIDENKAPIKLKLNNITVIIITIIIIVIAFISLPKKVEVPNLVGMTVEQAEKTIKDKNLEISISSCGNNKEIIATQNYQEGIKLKEGSTIYITTKEKQQEQQKQQEENKKIRETIEQHAKYVRYMNQGEMEYSSYSYYDTSDNDEKIYKIVYKTGSDLSNYKQYYHQLVSLTEDLSAIKKSTKLYYMTEVNGKEGAGHKLEMEFEAELKWGI